MKYDLELTQELAQSFRYYVLRSVNTLTMKFDFRMYGRFKGMALLRYQTHMPPVEAMEFFVEKIGLDKFACVEDYKGKQVPTVKNTTRRIAFAMNRRQVPSVKRGYRGTWYNSGKMAMINAAKKRIRWRASEWFAHQVKRAFESR